MTIGNLYGVDSNEFAQDWLSNVVGFEDVFTEASEFTGSTAMTASGAAKRIPHAIFGPGGWVCAQNSTVNPFWSELSEGVHNFAHASGETLLYFSGALAMHRHIFGFGENVTRSEILTGR